MSNVEEKAEAAYRALREEIAAGRKTTAYNVYDFLGNLGVGAGFLDDQGPEQVAARVRRCAEDHIPMFERGQDGRGFLIVDGKLEPLAGMRETYGVTVRDIEAVYLAAQEPLELPKLRQLLEPLMKGAGRFRESGFAIDG